MTVEEMTAAKTQLAPNASENDMMIFTSSADFDRRGEQVGEN